MPYLKRKEEEQIAPLTPGLRQERTKRFFGEREEAATPDEEPEAAAYAELVTESTTQAML